MDDIERRLAALADRAWSRVQFSPVLTAKMLRRIGMRRALAVSLAGLTITGVGLAGVLGISLFASGHGSRVVPGTPSPSGTALPAGWVTHTDDQGISIATPAAWKFDGGMVSGPLSPSVDFAVGTWNFLEGGDCAPTKALESAPQDAMLLFVYEYPSAGQPSDFPPRPAHFDLGSPVGSPECVGAPVRVIPFEDGGRFFQVDIFFGPNASQSLQDTTVQALDTIQVQGVTSGTTLPNRPTRCTSAPFMPTYLPWSTGSAPIAPTDVTRAGADLILRWSAPAGSPWNEADLSVMYSHYNGGPGRKLVVAGSLANVYYWFTKPARVSLFWAMRPGACGSYQLSLTAAGRKVSQSAVFSQLRLIAHSLRGR